MAHQNVTRVRATTSSASAAVRIRRSRTAGARRCARGRAWPGRGRSARAVTWTARRGSRGPDGGRSCPDPGGPVRGAVAVVVVAGGAPARAAVGVRSRRRRGPRRTRRRRAAGPRRCPRRSARGGDEAGSSGQRSRRRRSRRWRGRGPRAAVAASVARLPAGVVVSPGPGSRIGDRWGRGAWGGPRRGPWVTSPGGGSTAARRRRAASISVLHDGHRNAWSDPGEAVRRGPIRSSGVTSRSEATPNPTQAPPPEGVVTNAAPPWRSATSRTIARPSPEPGSPRAASAR